MRTVRVVVATVVIIIVIATYAFLHGSRRVTKFVTAGYHGVIAPVRRTTIRYDDDRFIHALGSLHEQLVAHALTAIDAFGRYVDEVRAAEEGLVPSELIPVDTALWERLHNCEQPDTWYASGASPDSESGTVFEGGLGMSVGAWQMAVRVAAERGISLPRSALSASVYQQMVGAQAFHDAYGWGWGCRV